MTLLLPSFVSILSEAVTAILPAETPAATLLYMLGADGSVELVDEQAQSGVVVSVQDGGDAVVLEVEDLAVAAETAATVTIAFGD